jgi:hypothetical protein
VHNIAGSDMTESMANFFLYRPWLLRPGPRRALRHTLCSDGDTGANGIGESTTLSSRLTSSLPLHRIHHQRFSLGL